MSELLTQTLECLKGIAPSDHETVANIRAAVATRALYFAEEDLGTTRREIGDAKAIYERYSVRNVMKKQITDWRNFYKNLAMTRQVMKNSQMPTSIFLYKKLFISNCNIWGRCQSL